MPEHYEWGGPVTVIYQTADDGLGSINITAAARSVLLVGRAKDDARIMAHVK